jgi:hypothetical protein
MSAMNRFVVVAVFTVVTMQAQVKVEKVDWKGWPNCYRVSNGEVELIVTSDVGPRVMHYALVGGRNVLKEFPEQMGKSGESEYQLRGGHRLWVAPEALETSWALDNGRVKIETRPDGLTATQPLDSASFEKSIRISMAASGSGVTLTHKAVYSGVKPIEMAPWTLTMMAQGGRAITGFPPRGTHPKDLLPTNPLVLWAYTNLADKRWTFYEKYLTLRQDPGEAKPQKLGSFSSDSWGAYALGDLLFTKRTEAYANRRYPDFGCSFETFTNADMLEMEFLGPLRRLTKGQAAELTEHWTLRRGADFGSWTEADLDRVLGPALAEKPATKKAVGRKK